MPSNRWMMTALFVVAVAFVLGSFAGYFLIAVTGTSLPQTLRSGQRVAAATKPPAGTPTAVETTMPVPPSPTATPEPATPTSTILEIGTAYTLPHGPTIIPPEPASPDTWEPDDSLYDARLIQVGETQRHNLHVVGDHDWVYFEAEEGTSYVIETLNLGSDLDTIIYLYDEEENQLTSDDDGADDLWASRLWWTATERGTLYVTIHDFGDNEAGAHSNYDISFSLGEAFEKDQYEPDSSRAEASEIVTGESQTHNLHIAGDGDWVYFEAEEGMTYIIETAKLGGDIDTIIYLYDEEGNELASDDDKGGEPLASRLEWTATQDGILKISVRDLRGGSAGPGTEYDISLSFRQFP